MRAGDSRPCLLSQRPTPREQRWRNADRMVVYESPGSCHQAVDHSPKGGPRTVCLQPPSPASTTPQRPSQARAVAEPAARAAGVDRKGTADHETGISAPAVAIFAPLPPCPPIATPTPVRTAAAGYKASGRGRRLRQRVLHLATPPTCVLCGGGMVREGRRRAARACPSRGAAESPTSAQTKSQARQA